MIMSSKISQSFHLLTLMKFNKISLTIMKYKTWIHNLSLIHLFSLWLHEIFKFQIDKHKLMKTNPRIKFNFFRQIKIIKKQTLDLIIKIKLKLFKMWIILPKKLINQMIPFPFQILSTRMKSRRSLKCKIFPRKSCHSSK